MKRRAYVCTHSDFREPLDQVLEIPRYPIRILNIQANTQFWPLVIVLAVLVIAAILLLVYVLKK